MLRTTLALCAVVLSGCSYDGGAQAAGGGVRPQPCAVDVWLVDGEAVVGQDPVHTRNCPNDKKLTWTAQDGMKFDGDGIAFAMGKNGTAPPYQKQCEVAATTLTCKFKGWQERQSYYYTLSLVDASGNKKKVDPSVFVD